MECTLTSFFPLITRPTRITSHTKTLIDNIFANQFRDHPRSGLLFTEISDHLPVFFIKFKDFAQQKPQEALFVCDKILNNIDNFKRQLKKIDWSQIEDCAPFLF